MSRAARTSVRYCGAMLLLGTTMACGGAPRADDRAARAGRTTVESDTSGGLVRYAAERDMDVTGDHVRDRIVVTATGPSYDSLTVRLEIQSRDGTPLFTDQWSSQRYFKYTPRAGLTDSAVKRIVLGHLTGLLADSAFTPASANDRRTRIDTAMVAYDMREITLRAMHQNPDTVPLTPALYQALQRTTISPARVDSAIDSMRIRPRFTYFAGGEVTNTIAWDPKLAHFVKTFSCC